MTAPGTLTAEALAAAVAAIDATIVFASPAALANVLRTGTSGDPRLARVRLVLSAGAPVPARAARVTSSRVGASGVGGAVAEAAVNSCGSVAGASVAGAGPET